MKARRRPQCDHPKRYGRGVGRCNGRGVKKTLLGWLCRRHRDFYAGDLRAMEETGR